MQTPFIKDFQTHKHLILACVFAIALQIQVTLFNEPGYQGLRVNAADFFLPFVGLGILYSLLRKTSAWPQWKAPFGYWSIGVLCIAVLYGAVNGYLLQGSLSQWALINKTIGFGILMAYLALGAWIVCNAREDIIHPFVTVFAGFFCVTLLVDLYFFIQFWEWKNEGFRAIGKNLDGLMYNRSAYGFVFLSLAVAMNEIFLKPPKRARIESVLLHVFWALAPIFVMLNSSRILWLCLIPIFLLNALRYPAFFFKRIVPLFLIGASLTFFLLPDSQRLILKPFYLSAHAASIDVGSDSDTVPLNTAYDLPRLQILIDSVALYREHPLRGAGLGAIIEEQKEQYGEVLTVLDNTPLWVLTEMGPFGLFAFIWVYLVMLAAFFKKNKNGKHSAFAMGAAFMLLGFGVFSLFHEILYSRFMWFILGMALVLPIKQRQVE